VGVPSVLVVTPPPAIQGTGAPGGLERLVAVEVHVLSRTLPLEVVALWTFL